MKVIAYGSRSLSQAEKRYHSGNLEFLELKWAICERFRDYLYHAPLFVVYRDNNPLTYLNTTAKLCLTITSLFAIALEGTTMMRMVCLGCCLAQRNTYKRGGWRDCKCIYGKWKAHGSYEDYVSSWKENMKEAYQIRASNADKAAACGKANYD